MEIIHLGPALPTASSGQPGSLGRATHALPYSALLQVGFTWPALSPGPPVRSYRTVSALPRPLRPPALLLVSCPGVGTREPAEVSRPGGLLSVALSFGSPRPGVTRHPALWSSDFPPAAIAAGDLLSHSTARVVADPSAARTPDHSGGRRYRPQPRQLLSSPRRTSLASAMGARRRQAAQASSGWSRAVAVPFLVRIRS